MDEIVKIKGALRLEEWREMIRARTESELGVAEWCKANGINLKTYYYRLKKVREKACERLEGRREDDAQQIIPISLPLCEYSGVDEHLHRLKLNSVVAND